MDFFTSDHHFYHKNIIEYCNRPYADLEEMHDDMIAKWNETVGNDDRVYCLGDFSFGNVGQTKDILAQLNGYKILIRGNHDSNGTCKLFDEWHQNLDFHSEYFTFLLSHYPYKTDGYEDKRELYTPTSDKFLIHGHVHNKWNFKGNMINVGVDVWDFYPIPLEYIEESYASRGTEW